MTESFADGGYVRPTDAVTWWPDPPRYVPRGGMCWRAPNGSLEWLMPAPPDMRPGKDQE